ncbi:MAG: hypothetical protein JXB15_01620 [Anaerolineales bacterium]|nr:hypothetical protein [Anaerolineales bacterium]
MIRAYLPGATYLAASGVFFILGFSRAGFWPFSLAIAALGLLWAGSLWKHWVSPIFLLAGVGLAVGGVWLGASILWIVFGLAAAVAAWDLLEFSWRLRAAQKVEHLDRLMIRHLIHLSWVMLAGTSLALASWLVKLNLDYPVLLFLSGLVVVGLAATLRMNHRQN